MRIHFVCSGNFYRSRLAEAYLKSKKIPGFIISSSGTESKENYFHNGPISWYAMRLLKNYRLIAFMKKLPTQTTEKILKKQDIVVFMTESKYRYAREHFGFEGKNCEIWNIPDLDQFKDYETWKDNQRIEATEKTFEEIRKRVDGLVKNLLRK